MRIHHVGIAVDSLEKSVSVFEKLLGRPPVSREEVEDQKARVAVFALGDCQIELLEATSPDSPIGRFLARRGQGIHHLTLSVSDLPGKLAELARDGVQVIDREPRVGAGQQSIAFLHPSSTAGVLIELVEEK